MEIVDIAFKAGRSAIDLALFVLLPVMVVMLFLMRLLESRGIMDRIVTLLAPLLKPAGLSGLSVMAGLQINFVGFAAPVATLAIMDKRGVSERHLAATLGTVMAMGQANVVFPMASMGLHVGKTLLFSLLGGVAASMAAYYVFGRRLTVVEVANQETAAPPGASSASGILDAINGAGSDAFRIAIGVIPMLVLSLVSIAVLQYLGVFSWITGLLAPILRSVNIDPAIILPTLTKYLAGGTALLGLFGDMARAGTLDTRLVNESAGWLIHALDLPGMAILVSAGKRLTGVWKPAALGACVGIGTRTLLHLIF